MKPGDAVAWTWGAGIAEGTIEAILPERTEIISKEKRIVRNGSPDNPAVIIRHRSGTKVLKLQSEIRLSTI